MNKKLIKYSLFILVCGLTFALDFLSKEWVLEYFHDKDVNHEEYTSFFNLVLSYNAGVSFGIFNNAEYAQWMFIALTGSIVFCMLCWFIVSKDSKLSLPTGLIIGGAIGNIVNRITYGAVIDFLDFHIGLWHYPAFNIADSAICIGVFILIFFSTPSKVENKRQLSVL